jgi:hypothetical protein
MPKYDDGTPIYAGHMVMGAPIDQPAPSKLQVVGPIEKVLDEDAADPDVRVRVDRYLVASPDGGRTSCPGDGRAEIVKASALRRLF